MTDPTFKDRLSFHEAIETMEVDFSGMTFASDADVDLVYDEIDQRAGATGRRWYFMVNYTGCVIAPGAWDRYAARGKSANINYGLGTVRVGASAQTREAIREDAGRAMFRANIFETRDQALFALAEMRKRRHFEGGDTADAYLRVEDVHLSFGGVKALTAVGFHVNRSEISSIIGPNGAGKSSMLNVISGCYRASRGQIFLKARTAPICAPTRWRAWDSRGRSRTSRCSRA